MNLFRYQWVTINFLGLSLLAYVITEPFDFRLLFLDTTLTGGDGGSWLQIAKHLKESLIPNGRLFGWDQGNFFGYANLQHYFVLPFLTVVLLSYLIPLTVALKIVTVSGFFALPFIVYWALHKLRYQAPIPLASAWISLAFLFHERYTMFGGNMLSMMAGEFCYSIAFSLMIVFMASFISDVKLQKISLRNGLLLGLIGLSHAFVFFIAILMPIFFLLNKPTRQTVKIILVTYLFGFLIMAFWVLPMLSSLNYTTPLKLIWRFPNTSQFLHSIHYETLLVTAICLTTFYSKPFRSGQGSFFAYLIICSTILYLIASALHIPDIRFFPAIFFFSLLLIIDRLAILISLHKVHRHIASISIVSLSIIFGGSWVYDENNEAADWFEWNYSGYESRQAFVDGRAEHIFNSLRGTYSDPRVAWEQGEHDLDFGTDRVFENIPLFTGRASTEGIHYASSISSLPITILNGEYSKTPASPSANIYSHYFIDTLPQRFEMFNIRDFIAFSPEITQLMKASEQFSVFDEQPPYTLFRWKNYNTQYVASPKYSPLVTNEFSDWKHRYANWFRRGQDLDLTIVNTHLISDQLREQFFGENVIELMPSGIINGAIRTPLQQAFVDNVTISNLSLSFDTNKPGTPHIIKVSYSPNWKSINAEPIFMVAPGFMMIYPKTEHIELVYARHWSEHIGAFLSLTGLLLILFFSRYKQLLPMQLSRPWVENSVSIVMLFRKPFLTVFCLILFFTSVWSFFEKRAIYSDYVTGTELALEGKLEEAVEYYKKNTTIDKVENIDDVDIPTSMYALARTYRDLGKTELAEKEFSRLIYYYPRWVYIDEIYWHLGEIYFNKGDLKQAKRMFEQCVNIEQIGINAERCRSRLTENAN